MLTTSGKKPRTQEHYRSGSTDPHFETFSTWLEARGYHPRYRRHLLSGAHRFALWSHHGKGVARELNVHALEEFQRELQTQQLLRYPNGGYSDLFMGARHLVTFLEASGHAAPLPSVSSDPQLFVDFCDWMQTHRGVSAVTLTNYRRPLLAFLQTLGEDPTQYDARALRVFILQQTKGHGVSSAKTVVTTVRTFLRFLIAVGQCAPELTYAIPTVASWRLASLPRYLSAEAIECMLVSCEITTLIGLRDRAVLLLLARLGLRAGDVAALRLTDIDWHAGTIQVVGKMRRQTCLPLPQEVGEAILAYLKLRPLRTTEAVFLTTSAPIVALTRQAVGKIATRAIQRAGIATPVHGSHILRHSAATLMLRHGVPLPAIAAVLRHSSMETTTGYAKVDVPLLQQATQPWPEVTSCS
ncbi:MAG: integrase [Deltaproteobacteria bacterium]|nr:integrase [Deltaproteobacteria bacterium]